MEAWPWREGDWLMRRLAWIFGLLAMLCALAVLVFARIGVLDLGLALPAAIVLNADPIAKLGMLVTGLGLIVALLLGWTSRSDAVGTLRVIAWAAPAIGLFACLYVSLNISIAIQKLHPPLVVAAPSIAEVFMVAATGFLTGAVAAAFASRPVS